MRIMPSLAIPATLALTLTGSGMDFLSAQEKLPPPTPLELAPAPRPYTPHVRMFPSPGGFQVALSRPAAELLRDVLEKAADEKQIAKMLRESAILKRESSEEEAKAAAARLELIAFVVSSQLPTFKKDLRERMGTHGVVIQVVGLQRPKLFRKPRPILEAGIEIATRVVSEMTPEEVGRTIEATKAMVRTTPLGWSVLPQE